MRTHPILLLALGLTLAACQDGAGPSTTPPTVGTLVVSTTSGGNDPDQDGYLLTVDGVDSLRLDPTGTSMVDLLPGQHTLRLLGMADHCSVTPGSPLDVAVPSRDTTSVAFEVMCSVTGVRITTTTTGLDFDTDGYRVEANGLEQGTLPSNGTVLIRLDPGSLTIALTDLASNCALDGPDSHAVTIVADAVVPVEFAVTCTTTSGVIGVVVSEEGVGAMFGAIVDGVTPFSVELGGRGYLAGVSAGDHVVSLNPPANCSVETGPQSVTVTAGTLIRDTVEVAFSVTCQTMLTITAPTTGPIPQDDYSVWLCYDFYSCNYHFPARRLGSLAPNDTLIAEVDPGTYWLHLEDLVNCQVVVPNPRQGENPRRDIVVGAGQSVSVSFPVVCS